jgi:hypothetical protein
MIFLSDLKRLEAHANPPVDHLQGIGPNGLRGWFTFDAAIANIERRPVQRTVKTICAQTPALQFRLCMGALVFDGEKISIYVTDQNVVAREAEGLHAALGYLCDIRQILIRTGVQKDCSERLPVAHIVASADKSQRGFLCPPILLFFFDKTPQPREVRLWLIFPSSPE